LLWKPSTLTELQDGKGEDGQLLVTYLTDCEKIRYRFRKEKAAAKANSEVEDLEMEHEKKYDYNL
jgi:hypothetical protein